nr:unnamed protein product [Callosobruchus chinensis]
MMEELSSSKMSEGASTSDTQLYIDVTFDSTGISETLSNHRSIYFEKLFKNSCVDISSAEARLLNSNKACDGSCKVCRSFGNDIKDLILKLQNDIQAFKTTRSDEATLNRNEFLEEVISELSERNKRRKNVIIFGVPEQDANDDGDTADKDKVTDILHTIDRNFSLQDVKIVRLGKQTDGKIRLIRVTCNIEQQVSDIVRIAGKLKNSRFKNKNVYDTKKSAINSLLNVLNLQQCNNVVNDTGRILGLVLSHMNCTVIREKLPLVPEDIPYHPALDITLENISTRATIFPQLNDLSMYNFHKANFPGLYEELFFADWSFLDNLTDLNLGTEKFYSFIYNTLDIYLSKYLSHNRTRNGNKLTEQGVGSQVPVGIVGERAGLARPLASDCSALSVDSQAEVQENATGRGEEEKESGTAANSVPGGYNWRGIIDLFARRASIGRSPQCLVQKKDRREVGISCNELTRSNSYSEVTKVNIKNVEIVAYPADMKRKATDHATANPREVLKKKANPVAADFMDMLELLQKASTKLNGVVSAHLNTKKEIKEVNNDLQRIGMFLKRSSVKNHLDSVKWEKVETPTYDADTQTEHKLAKPTTVTIGVQADWRGIKKNKKF